MVNENLELEFMRLLSHGASVNAIARATKYTPDTVGTYIVAIRRKYNARNVHHLVGIGYRVGILKIN